MFLCWTPTWTVDDRCDIFQENLVYDNWDTSRLRTCVVKEVGSFKKNSGSNINVLNNSPSGDKALVSLQNLNLMCPFQYYCMDEFI